MTDDLDVFVLDRTLPSAAPGAAPNAFALPQLPLAVLPHGAPPPADARVLGVRLSYPLPLIRILQGIDYCLGRGATVINLSLGPAALLPGSDTDPDPLYVAARTAWDRGTPLVVAAGNEGLRGLDSLQFLARSPWCISVGATDANDVLLDISARGVPGVSGPTVVSLGSIRDLQYVNVPGVEAPVILENQPPVEGAMRPREKYPRRVGPGTSYAAPRVSTTLAWLRVLLNIVISDARTLLQHAWTDAVELAVPVVGLCDTGVDPVVYAACQPSGPGLLRHTEAQADWYRALLNTLFHDHGIESRIASDAAGLRTALLAIARPLPAYQPHEAGGGYVSLRELDAAIRGFTPRLWLKLFVAPEARARIPEAALDQLDARLGPLWDADAAATLVSHVHGTPGMLFVRII
jgi:hypothetical protein